MPSEEGHTDDSSQALILQVTRNNNPKTFIRKELIKQHPPSQYLTHPILANSRRNVPIEREKEAASSHDKHFIPMATTITNSYRQIGATRQFQTDYPCTFKLTAWSPLSTATPPTSAPHSRAALKK